MTAWQAILVLSLLVSGGVLGSAAPNTPWAEGAQQGASEHLIFVREFSSAHDVKRGLSPVLNRGLDIIAGPKEDLPATDILQKPYAVTTDAAHRVFVTDLSAGVVHVFDFVHSKYSNLHGGDRLSARSLALPLAMVTYMSGTATCDSSWSTTRRASSAITYI